MKVLRGSSLTVGDDLTGVCLSLVVGHDPSQPGRRRRVNRVSNGGERGMTASGFGLSIRFRIAFSTIDSSGTTSVEWLCFNQTKHRLDPETEAVD
jgi:hypothetical protein